MSDSIVQGLKVLKAADGKPGLCLVTGATGYIGGRLIRELLVAGYRVRVLARNASRLADHPWINKVEVIEGDATDAKVVKKALASVDVAYYLLHSLMEKRDFESQIKNFSSVSEFDSLIAEILMGPSHWTSTHSLIRC